MITTDIGIWIGALLTIFVFSFLYKDNKFFRFAEYTVIGAAVGHVFIMNVNAIIQMGWVPLIAGNYVYVVAFLGGALLYTKFWKKYAWLMRYGIAIIVGTSVSLVIKSAPNTDILKQIMGSMVPLVVLGDAFATINNIIIVVFTFSTILYFIFTMELMPSSKITDKIGRIGRIALYCALGYYLGNTVITRYSFLIDRLQYVLLNWLGLR